MQLISLHPCADECDPADPACDPTPCNVGVPTARRPFQGVIGADVLAGDAVRLRIGDDQLFVLADIGGTDQGRSLACDAVFDSPFRGGGTLVVSGTELPFGNRRITLQACLGPVPDADPATPIPQGQRGADALLVMSTSIGISIIDEAAYERYRNAHVAAAPPPAASLPQDAVYLPSGLVNGRRAHLDALALVAASTSNALAPCRQVYAHHFLAVRDCIPSDADCPCAVGDVFCNVPAIVELQPPAGIAVLIVDDDTNTLQALRTELRPDQPEVDGILGTDALRMLELDVDYPNARVLQRCTADRSICSARPELFDGDRVQVNGCIGG